MTNQLSLLPLSNCAAKLKVRLCSSSIGRLAGPRLNCAICLLALALTAGCAGTRQYVSIPSSPQLQPGDPDHVRIYLMRPKIQGAAVAVEIQEGKDIVGKLGSHGHLCWERGPGEVRIVETKYTYQPLKFNATAGSTYYVAWESSVFSSSPKMRLLSQEDGLKMLKQCSRKPKTATK